MMIRPVTISDARHISEISSDVSVRRSMNISQACFTDAKNLIKNLTELDHLLVLET